MRRLLADRAPVTPYVRDALRRPRPRGRPGVARAGRPRRRPGCSCPRRTAARGRDGRRRGGARGTGPGGVPVAVRVVGGRGGRARHRPRRAPASTRSWCPAWPTARPSARSRSTKPRGGTLAEPTTPASRSGSTWRVDGAKAHVPDGASATLLLVTARTDDGELGVFAVEATSDGVTVEPTAIGRRFAARKRRVTFAGAAGWRLGTDATARRRAACSIAWPSRTSSTVSARGRGVGARSRVRQGAGAVRQADRLVPGRATPLRRHAAHRRARAGPPAYYACWARRRRDARRGTPRGHDGAGVRERDVRATRRRPRSRCSAASASRGSTTSTSSTSACSPSRVLGTADDHLEELATIALSTSA